MCAGSRESIWAALRRVAENRNKQEVADDIAAEVGSEVGRVLVKHA